MYANVPGAVPRSFATHCSQQSYRSVSIVSWPLGCADVRFDQFDVLCPTVNSPTFFLAHSRDEDQLTKDIERENIVVAGKKFNANVCGTTVRNVCIWICKLGCAIVRTPNAENLFYFFFFSVFQKDAVTNAIKEHMREHIRKVLDGLMLVTKTRL